MQKISERIDAEIISLDHAINIEAAYDKEVKGQAPYKLLQQFIESPWGNKNKKQTEEERDKLHSEALQLDMKLKASFDSFKSEYSPKFIKPARTLISTVKDSREQVISPLYVLLYSIVIFICDEIVYNVPSVEGFIMTFLTVFTVLSFGLWLMLWFSFVRDIKIIPEDSNNVTSQRHTRETGICNHLKWINTMVYIMVFIVLFYTVSTYISDVVVGRIVAFGIGIFLPILIVAMFKVRSHSRLGEYLYMFVFKHFLGLSFLSLAIATISLIASNYSEAISQIHFEYTNFITIKFAIISFIIINGLLLPFIVPFKSFYRVLNLAKKEVETTQTKLDSKLRETAAQLNAFCSKI